MATVVTLACGVPIAWLLARKATIFKDAMGAIVVAPLVLPPTVLGYYLLTVIGARGPVGRVLESAGIELAFTWRAAVLAAAVGSIPLLIKTVQAGFETVDVRLEQAARTLGRSEWSVFWSVTVPLSWRAFVAGTVLAFCRALGDFGITLMVAGSIPGSTQTVPLAIYDFVQADRMHDANLLAALTVTAVVVVLVGFARLARLRY
jgi:molybdate transport system permease protein